jgi:UDP-N-acetylmuramoylalanine-D-glutamate ligase
MQSRLQQRKQKRDIIYLREADAPSADYMWRYGQVMDYVRAKYPVTEAQIKFMLFVYSMESWKLEAVCDKLNRDKRVLWQKVVRPLVEEGYVKEEMYSKGPDDPFYANVNADTFSSHKSGVIMRRWALSTEGRYLLSNFYKWLEGSQSFSL